jgi:hypothetical protein
MAERSPRPRVRALWARGRGRPPSNSRPVRLDRPLPHRPWAVRQGCTGRGPAFGDEHQHSAGEPQALSLRGKRRSVASRGARRAAPARRKQKRPMHARHPLRTSPWRRVATSGRSRTATPSGHCRNGRQRRPGTRPSHRDATPAAGDWRVAVGGRMRGRDQLVKSALRCDRVWSCCGWSFVSLLTGADVRWRCSRASRWRPRASRC